MLLALLIAAAGINPAPLVDGVGGTPYPLALPRGCRDRLCARGTDDMVPAFFEFAPLGGTGMGTACGACNNIIKYPQDLDQSSVWLLENSVVAVPTITANAHTAPDGTLTAERVQIPATTAGQFSATFQQPNINFGATSASIYVFGNGASDTTDLCQWNGSGHTCVACAYTNGVWSLCTNLNVNGGAAPTFTIGNVTGLNGGINRNAADIFVWGGQWNSGATVNAYTPAPAGRKAEALTFTRASSATCLKTVGLAPQLIANGDMVTCSTGQVRVMPGTDGTSYNGVLDEVARTNLVIQSQSFDNVAWTKGQVGAPVAPTVTADFAVAPDGTTTAERVQFAACPAVDSSSYIFQIGLGSTAQYAGSVWCRGNGSNQTISACVQGAGGGSACSAVTCPSAGWTVISRIASITTTGGPVFGCNNLSAYTGSSNTGAADVLLWGGQFELGAYPSSYIATTTASAARVADLADVAITLPALTQLCVGDTIITPSDISVSQAVLTGTLGDGALGGAAGSTNYFTSQYSGGTALAVTSGAGLPTSASFGSALTGAHRYTVFHTGSLLSGCVDGICAAGTAGVFSNPTFTRFRLGMFAVTSNNMGGITKLVTIDPTFSRCR
jgi:hypothetical protein